MQVRSNKEFNEDYNEILVQQEIEINTNKQAISKNVKDLWHLIGS